MSMTGACSMLEASNDDWICDGSSPCLALTTRTGTVEAAAYRHPLTHLIHIRCTDNDLRLNFALESSRKDNFGRLVLSVTSKLIKGKS